MTVAQLIALLQQHDPEAEVFIAQNVCAGVTSLESISGIHPATSDYYGRAVLLEMED